MEKRQKRFYENISTSALKKKKDSFIYENVLSYCQLSIKNFATLSDRNPEEFLSYHFFFFI